jgi:hypothetical protein
VNLNAMHAYGMAVGVWERPRVRIILEGVSTPNARTGAAIRLLRELMPIIAADNIRGTLFIQYDDCIHNNLCSIAFGKRKGEAPAVKLIPDTYFLNGRGYEELRNAVHGATLPPWETRRDVVFWRGAATSGLVSSNGAPVERLEHIPRVELCLKLRDVSGADVAICQPWGFQFEPEIAVKWFTDQRIYRPPVSPLAQAQNRYLMDIDGVANAWGFFEKLLLGCCILKVQSDYEQWFYESISAWEHFVPVRSNLSDLVEQINWCRDHSEKAAQIGARGQAFALSQTFSVARERMLEAAGECFIPY